MFSSNCSRGGLVEAGLSLAWSIVASDAALAEACLRRLATLVDAGEPALWKRVTISRDLGCRPLNCQWAYSGNASSMKIG